MVAASEVRSGIETSIPGRRWEDNIKMDVSGSAMWGYGLDRSGSGQGHVAGTCECGNEPLGSIE